LKPETILLWISAPLTLGLGALAIAFASRRPKPIPSALTAEEEARLAELARGD
jgi:cytochrome c-type biogenesis protein CcmH/NrfF